MAEHGGPMRGPGGLVPFMERRRPRVFTISGTTIATTGAPIGECVVHLFTSDDNVWQQTTTSNSVGAYKFYVRDGSRAYYIVAYKSGSPDRSGTTLNTLVGA